MAKREALLTGEEVGTTLDTVEALIKKHEDFDKSLQAQVRGLPCMAAHESGEVGKEIRGDPSLLS